MCSIANVHVEYYMASVRVSLRVQRPAPLAIVVSIIPTNYHRWLMAPGADNQWPYMQTASHAHLRIQLLLEKLAMDGSSFIKA